MRRLLFATDVCYLDASNGASVASRSMMESLARHGFATEALSGMIFERGCAVNSVAWLGLFGVPVEAVEGDAWTADPRGLHADVPPYYRLTVDGVPVTLARRATLPGPAPGDDGYEDLLRLHDAALDLFQPDVLISYGGDRLSHEFRSRARARGAAVAFPLHNFNYHHTDPFATADAVIVPSRFAADYYRRALGLECAVLPNLVDPSRVRVEGREPRYLTLVTPSYEKGVYVLARIADELGRRRPDIPILVVEGRGSERTLADCGLDLRGHGNVFLMGHTPDPRQFWSVTRICLMPSLWWENQPLVAIEAMINGIPVIASDRGGIPETLGDAGIILPLPERLTPATRSLPTVEEVTPWIEAILHLWDDEAAYREHSRRALAEARRWDPEVLEPQYVRFFQELRPKSRAPASPAAGHDQAPCPIPHTDGIQPE